MYRYFKRTLESPTPTRKNDNNEKSSREEFDPMNLEADPGKWFPIVMLIFEMMYRELI